MKIHQDIKFPVGFICEKCGCREYSIVKRKNVKSGYIVQCRHCHRQYSVLAGMIFQSAKIALQQILLMLYLFFTSNKGIPSPEMANYGEVSEKTACQYLRKFRWQARQGCQQEDGPHGFVD